MTTLLLRMLLTEMLLLVVFKGAITVAWISSTLPGGLLQKSFQHRHPPPHRSNQQQKQKQQRLQHETRDIRRIFPTRTLDHSWSLHYSTNGKDETEAQRRRRMELVRSLQSQFYASPSSYTQAKPHTSEGSCNERNIHSPPDVLVNLPLWQVNWLELPGRTNVWNVFEPIYTNMLETILHSNPPWYVGHLYYDYKDTNGIMQFPLKRRLQTWHEFGYTNNRANDAANADVLGTLLRIVDYRRMNDGRLLLLVQGLERFVVTEIVQERPYTVAHVQLLPDWEEIGFSDGSINSLNPMHGKNTEGDVALARSKAVASSFQRWHRYEFEQTMLPLPLQNQDLSADQVLGGALAKVLPYAPYSSVVNLEQEESSLLQEDRNRLKEEDEEETTQCHINENATVVSTSLEPPLEYRLLERGILKNPLLSNSIDPSLLSLSSDELEVRIWLALNDFLQQSKKPVSPILLGFLPHNVDWSTEAVKISSRSGNAFVLEQIANSLEQPTKLQSKFVRLSPLYPALRRQKRLSFTAPALLEHSRYSDVHELRRILLAIPCTHVRLVYLLQLLLDEMYGAFQ